MLSSIDFFKKEEVQKKFEEILWNDSNGFLATIMSIVSNNDLLKKANTTSLYNAALTAATMKLPINPSLGYAYIVPYAGEAQFQMGYKWYIQLAHRSWMYETIGVSEIREWQITKHDPLHGYEFDFSEEYVTEVIGYASFFKLRNGFYKTFYMSSEKLEKHAKKYSKTYDKWKGLRVTDRDGMCKKTVLKLNISKFWPTDLSMQTALLVDQAVIQAIDPLKVNYPDNEEKTPSLEETLEWFANDATK